jgi:benzoyl-CoA 2,3-dioxygenase component B
MVYLLHAHFGRDGREEGEALLARRSGDADNPRILTAFNEKTPDWLSFFMFTFITDRDGKYQLAALAESGFDPLSRTCRFMLTEEAHHMFVGESGIARIIQRTCDAMKEHKTEDAAKLRGLGVIDLPTLQKYLNFHYSVTSDLYGSEISSNAASAYANGIKGRFEETKLADDHKLHGSEYPYMEVVGNQIVVKHAPALTALNERLRDDWVADVQAGVSRWNRIPEKAGIAFRFTLPHKGFHRRIGLFTEHHVSPDGKILSEADWTRQHTTWLPSEEDRAYVCSLMGRVAEQGKFANWIAPPARGINNQPADYEYVRFN